MGSSSLPNSPRRCRLERNKNNVGEFLLTDNVSGSSSSFSLHCLPLVLCRTCTMAETQEPSSLLSVSGIITTGGLDGTGIGRGGGQWGHKRCQLNGGAGFQLSVSNSEAPSPYTALTSGSDPISATLLPKNSYWPPCRFCCFE